MSLLHFLLFYSPYFFFFFSFPSLSYLLSFLIVSLLPSLPSFPSSFFFIIFLSLSLFFFRRSLTVGVLTRENTISDLKCHKYPEEIWVNSQYSPGHNHNGVHGPSSYVQRRFLELKFKSGNRVSIVTFFVL